MQLFINWNPSPEIINLGFISLRWYSVLYALTFICGFYILKNIYKREGKNVELVDTFLFYAVLGVVVGARLGHCLFYEPTYYLNHITEMLLPIQEVEGHYKFVGYQGLASHGGAIGLLFINWLYTRKYKLGYLWMIDRIVITVALGGLFIRTGNLMNSEIIGHPTQMPWAFIFERVDMIPRHPAQLYEAIIYFCIFLFLAYLYLSKKGKTKDGIIFGWFLILIFSARFFIEFLKEDQTAFEQGMTLNMGQMLSIPLIVTGIVVLVWKSRDSFKMNVKI